jgi:hypothetical protein
MGIIKRKPQIEDESPVEVEETPAEEVVLETPVDEEKAPEPVQYAPGEGSMTHPF